MDPDLAREFLRTHHHAVLATVRADGSPQMSPVAVALDDAGRAVVSTRETAYKVKNLRRDPRAWLCVLQDGFFGEWISIGGDVEIVSLPDALELLVDYYRRVSGEHPDWADYRAAMVRDRRCVIRVTITSAGPNRAG